MIHDAPAPRSPSVIAMRPATRGAHRYDRRQRIE